MDPGMAVSGARYKCLATDDFFARGRRAAKRVLKKAKLGKGAVFKAPFAPVAFCIPWFYMVSEKGEKSQCTKIMIWTSFWTWWPRRNFAL